MEEVVTDAEKDINIDALLERNLVIHNDDFTSFELVIISLVEICGHSLVQAEQCAWITHYKGKCKVKHGSYEFLSPLKQAILDRKINCTIE